jgi:hypothetical protein
MFGSDLPLTTTGMCRVLSEIRNRFSTSMPVPPGMFISRTIAADFSRKAFIQAIKIFATGRNSDRMHAYCLSAGWIKNINFGEGFIPLTISRRCTIDEPGH